MIGSNQEIPLVLCAQCLKYNYMKRELFYHEY
jgi:hypothetical protein